jgi:replicative DNA helicase
MIKLTSLKKASVQFNQHLRDVKAGKIIPLDTGIPKVNAAMMDGLEWHVLWTVAGSSGAGKSAFANMLETNILEKNPTENIAVLNFTLEMLPFKQVARKVSRGVSKSVKEMHSHKVKFNTAEFQGINSYISSIQNYDITFAEGDFTLSSIESTILDFYEKKKKEKGEDVGILVFFDHMLLTADGGDERLIIKSISNMLAKLTNRIKCSVIALSQLNRDIESMERIVNPTGHFPIKKDLFGGDSIFQASDYVSVLHRPERLNIAAYGPHKWPTQDKIYLHYIKVREGEEQILTFDNQLKYNNLAY